MSHPREPLLRGQSPHATDVGAAAGPEGTYYRFFFFFSLSNRLHPAPKLLRKLCSIFSLSITPHPAPSFYSFECCAAPMFRSVAAHPTPSFYAVPKSMVGHDHGAVEARVGHGAGVVIPQPRLQRPPLVRVAVFAHHGIDHHLPNQESIYINR